MTHTVVLTGQHSRERAAKLIYQAPAGFVASIREPKRTTDQNSLLWAMLTDVSLAKPMGRRMTPEEWKCVFMNACGWEVQFLEGLDGRPFPQGFRSSQLSKTQMSTLIDFIQAWGDEQAIVWSDPQTKEAA